MRRVASWLIVPLGIWVLTSACGSSGPAEPVTSGPNGDGSGGTPLSGTVGVELLRAEDAAALLFSGQVSVVRSAGLTEQTVLDWEPPSFFTVPPGAHAVSAAIRSPDDCNLVGDASQEVQVSAGATVFVRFMVTCSFEPSERIVYAVATGFGDLRSIRPDGSDPLSLTTDGRVSTFPAWSPDGTRIAHACEMITERDPLGEPGICVMNWNGTQRRKPFFQGRGLPDRIEKLTWSPDGTQIAFSAVGPGLPPDQHDIFVMNVDGSSLRRVNSGEGDDRSPWWSSDGRIAFSRSGTVTVMNSDGSGVATLRGGLAPKWSPDGHRITYLSPEFDVWIMNDDGTDPTRLTDLGQTAGAPSFSPDGERILFHVPRLVPDNRIWIMNADGSNPKPFEPIPNDPWAAHAVWWGPQVNAP